MGGATGQELAAVQILRKGNGAEPESLDPHRAEGVTASNVLRDLFEGLITEAADGALIPGAAESWTISDDGRVYTFRLQPNGRWSNGDPWWPRTSPSACGAAPIRPRSPSTPPSSIPSTTRKRWSTAQLPPDKLGVRAIDDRTLEIRLHSPTPYLLGLLTHSSTYAVHRPSVEKFGDKFARPGNLVSNGAYRLNAWVVQSHIQLVRNPYYWDNARTTINEVWYYPVENAESELNRYRADEFDMTETVPTGRSPGCGRTCRTSCASRPISAATSTASTPASRRSRTTSRSARRWPWRWTGTSSSARSRAPARSRPTAGCRP